MKYNLLILPRAKKGLSKLPEDVYVKMRDKILSLSSTQRPLGCKRLRGRDGWRIRLGNYRTIYEIDDNKKSITILDVSHRKNIYKK